MRTPSGVTALELLVALSCLSIASATALLGWPVLRDRWQMHAAARQVVLDLRRARVHATAEGRTHRIVFAAGSSQYQLERKQRGGFEQEDVPIELPSGTTVTGCTARGSAITFRPRGNLSTFGTISLAGRRGEQCRVIVDMAGRARISR
jgi:type II secretory pathway pseudopilin PulG